MILFEPASSLAPEELLELFNAAYEGYVVPFRLDDAALRFMLEAFDYDLDGSYVASEDGRPLGLALLGLRGEDSWCGGVGVVPGGRGRGLGERLMRALLESAHARGAARMRLEVIDRNEAARALYAKLGFSHVREVEVWSLEGRPDEEPAHAPVDEAHAWIRARSRGDEPWQRTDGTVARLRRLHPAPVGVVVDGGAAVVRRAGGRAMLVQAAAEDSRAGERLLRAATAGADFLTMLNLPVDDPLAEVFRALGGRLNVRQHELELHL